MKEIIRDIISTSVEENMTYIKSLLVDNSDYVFRQFDAGEWKAAVIYIDGMSDKTLLNDYVMESLMKFSEMDEIGEVSEIANKVLTLTDFRKVDKMKDAVNASLAGEALLILEGLDYIYVIASRSWPSRGVGEASSETVIRGSRDGFTDTIRFNTALVRRRIRDTRLRIKATQVGIRSKTDVAMLYIDDIAKKDLVQDVESRISKIDIDAILDSSYIEQLIEDNKYSPFPQIQSTERPDVVSAALYEGRVAILVDNSPFALIVPATLPCFFQSPDDYYQKWIHASSIRILRTIALILALIIPAFYVAVSTFQTSIIPAKLAYSIAASRAGVPFPAFIEALIMEVSVALLVEAVIRLPKPIASTIGIVGGLVVGQAAVSAGIVSPIMMMVLGLTSMTTFLTPNYAIVLSFRLIRIILILMAAGLGVFGIVIGMLILLVHLIRLESFGTAYLEPFVNTHGSDFKDMILRYPLQFFKNRPKFLRPNDKVRQNVSEE